MNIIKFLAVEMFFILSISSVAGYAGSLYGIKFWATFLAVTALQFILGALVNKYIQIRNEISMRDIASRNMLIASYQQLELNCSYCNTKSNIRYVFNSDDIYECPNCKNKNKIIISAYTARITEPVAADVVVNNIFKELEKIKE